MSPIISGGGVASGGSSPATATATVTTSAATFGVVHVFDLARIALVQYRFTVTALNGDGETWGSGAGQIGVGFDPSASVSIDGVTYGTAVAVLPATLGVIDPDGFAVTVGQFEVGGTVTPRYLTLGVAIFDSLGNNYAGANHPTATVRFDLIYV